MFNIFRKVNTEWYQEKHTLYHEKIVFVLLPNAAIVIAQPHNQIYYFLTASAVGSCPLCLALFRKETNPVPILHITFCLRSCTKFSRIISVHMQTAELWCQKLDQLRVFSTKKLGGRHFSTRVSVHLCEIQDSDKAIYTLTLHRQSQLSKISQKNLHFSTKT